jgi:hypothetical protein
MAPADNVSAIKTPSATIMAEEATTTTTSPPPPPSTQNQTNQSNKKDESYKCDESFITRITHRVHRDMPRDLRARTLDSLSSSLSKIWRLSRGTSTPYPHQETQQKYKWSVAISNETFMLTVYRRKSDRSRAKAHWHIDLNDFLAINVKKEEDKQYLSVQLFFKSGVFIIIDFSPEPEHSRAAKELVDKLKEITSVIQCRTKCERVKCTRDKSCQARLAINSTLAIRVELERSPDEALGATFLTTETFFFTWETKDFDRNRKCLEKMIFRNEHNQHKPIELSKKDFQMWQFDPLNPHDMTVRGRLHTNKKSCLGHVILTIVFDDPYRLFHTTYKPLLDNQFVAKSTTTKARRSKYDDMRRWNEQRRQNDTFRYPNSSPLGNGLISKTPPKRSSRTSNSNSYGKSQEQQRKNNDESNSAEKHSNDKQPGQAQGGTGCTNQTQLANAGQQQTLNSIGNPNSPDFSP